MGSFVSIVPSYGVIVAFSGAGTAARLVAGLPAAARALREVALAGTDRCTIAVSGGWHPEPRARAELDRLADGMAYTIVDSIALNASDEPVVLLQGEHPVSAGRIGALLAGSGPQSASLFVGRASDWARLPRLSPAQAAAKLDRAAHAIVTATSKPGDGIVSQMLNRPLSQSISRVLLNVPGITPFQATFVSALIAVAMLGALVFGGVPGLVIGAVLYQIASIIDGVDGEIARATFRSSRAGAMADSLVDAVTNIGFLAGVAINLWIQGNAWVAIAGFSGLATMALGLFLIGRKARRSDNTFTFDGVKTQLQTRKSFVMQILIWLTMRDFFAFAWLIGIVAGVAAPGLLLFSFGAAIWLLVVLFVLRPQAT
jgi:CDP-L-myo-inositol myo-inositolphosphotransferase